MVTVILSLTEAVRIVGLSRTSIYRGIKTGTFPAPVKLSARRIGFYAETISLWLEARTMSCGRTQ